MMCRGAFTRLIEDEISWNAGLKNRKKVFMSRVLRGRGEKGSLKILGEPCPGREHGNRAGLNPEVRVFTSVLDRRKKFSSKGLVRLHPLIFRWVHRGERGAMVDQVQRSDRSQVVTRRRAGTRRQGAYQHSRQNKGPKNGMERLFWFSDGEGEMTAFAEH